MSDKYPGVMEGRACASGKTSTASPARSADKLAKDKGKGFAILTEQVALARLRLHARRDQGQAPASVVAQLRSQSTLAKH